MPTKETNQNGGGEASQVQIGLSCLYSILSIYLSLSLSLSQLQLTMEEGLLQVPETSFTEDTYP